MCYPFGKMYKIQKRATWTKYCYFRRLPFTFCRICGLSLKIKTKHYAESLIFHFKLLHTMTVCSPPLWIVANGIQLCTVATRFYKFSNASFPQLLPHLPTWFLVKILKEFPAVAAPLPHLTFSLQPPLLGSLPQVTGLIFPHLRSLVS